MRQWVIDHFPAYTVCGIGREADLQGESNIIAYRTDKFDLVSLDTFWLSDTPHRPGSRFATDQSGCPRICTVVTLRCKENGKLFELDKTEEEILKKNGSNAGLYCYDIESGRLLACVEDFTEYGELVDSVRYNGNYAYVCTARHATEQHDVNLDPVFFFDLSDLNNITYKDTGEIDGYSTSLVDFGNGYLLGIGVGASPDVFKLEVYTETADGVVPVCKYELVNTRYSKDYKSYYINREKNMLGIGLTGSPENTYVLFELTEGCIISATEIIPIHAAPGNMRGFIEDGWLYVMGEGDFKVVELK